MNIERTRGKLEWGQLDVNMFGVTHDWYGEKLKNPVGFSFAADENNLWFIATHAEPALLHPDARPGLFLRELWKYDVAEFFLFNPDNGHYLEFNLSPNGAWWAAEFTGPLEGMGEAPLQGVKTYSQLAPDGGWVTAASIDMAMLQERFHFGLDSSMNATFILHSPEQKFVTATDLGEGKPNFHQPDKFKPVNFFNQNDLKV